MLFRSKDITSPPTPIQNEIKQAALEKLAGNPTNAAPQDDHLGQQFKGAYENAPSLNVRRFGPYELKTLLQPNREKDSQHDMASDKLINEVRYLGGGHSEADMRKIAKELKDVNKPADYDYWKKTLGALNENDANNSVIQGRTRLSEASGENAQAKPLWSDEDEDKNKLK